MPISEEERVTGAVVLLSVTPVLWRSPASGGSAFMMLRSTYRNRRAGCRPVALLRNVGQAAPGRGAGRLGQPVRAPAGLSANMLNAHAEITCLQTASHRRKEFVRTSGSWKLADVNVYPNRLVINKG